MQRNVPRGNKFDFSLEMRNADLSSDLRLVTSERYLSRCQGGDDDI